MGWLNWIGAETGQLPLERPFRETLRIYAKRLSVFAAVVAAGFLLLLAAFAIHQSPLLLSIASLAFGVFTLWLMRKSILESFPETATDPIELTHAYRNAITKSNLRELRNLSRICKHTSFRPYERFVMLGEKILETKSAWRFESLPHIESSPYLQMSRVLEPGIEDRIFSELANYLAKDTSGTVYNRSPRGFTFALRFSPPDDRIDYRSQYVAHTSFWLAFYANSQAVIERLQPSLDEILSLRKRMWPVDVPFMYFYEFANLASAELLVRDRQMFEPAPSPSDLLLSNYYAWLFQKGAVEAVADILQREEINNLSPFVRIIVEGRSKHFNPFNP
jgi:hypothetical protein